MLDTQNPNPDTLLRIHGLQDRMLADPARKVHSHKAKTALYDELHVRHARVTEHLRNEDYPLATETMYGIAIGLDGLRRPWGPPKNEADASH